MWLIPDNLTMIWGLVFLLFLACYSCEEFTASCSNETSEPFIFRPSEDNVKGRYFHQWCTDKLEDPVQIWNLLVTVDNRKESECNDTLFGNYGSFKHSITERVVNQKFDCTKVCFTIKLDMIYSSCYSIQDWLTVDQKIVHYKLNTQYIDNPYTVEYFENSTTFATVEDDRESVNVHWYFSRIPRTDYALELRDHHEKVVPLNVSCLEWGQEIRCRVFLPAGEEDSARVRERDSAGVGVREGDSMWELTLTHRAAWCHNDVFKHATCESVVNFSVPRPAAPPTSPPSPPHSAVYWSAGALVVACCVATLLLIRVPHTGYWKIIMARCTSRYVAPPSPGTPATPPHPPSPPAPPPRPRGFLLLYARDADPFMKAMAALRDMLRHVANGEPVYDLFSPETVSWYSESPSGWLTHAVSECRVILVQTPALTELYQTTALTDHTDQQIKLVQPLLGSVVQYRSAQYGDAALSAALALLRDLALGTGAAAALHYRQYYVCSISELEVDMLPHVVPYRRYQLPAAAPLLLSELSPPQSPPQLPSHLMELLTNSLQQYIEYVRGYPDYLQDLLTFL